MNSKTVCQALSAVPGLARVTRGWPPSPMRFPAAVVEQIADRTADRRDGAAYLREQEFYVRLFSQSMDELDALVGPVDAALAPLLMERVFGQEENGAQARQLCLRYRVYEA